MALEREHLGSDHDVVTTAASRKPLTDDGFGLATRIAGNPGRVDVGGIDGTTASLDEASRTAKLSLASDVQPKVLPPRTRGPNSREVIRK
jgi:hypothetical protein